MISGAILIKHHIQLFTGGENLDKLFSQQMEVWILKSRFEC